VLSPATIAAVSGGLRVALGLVSTTGR